VYNQKIKFLMGETGKKKIKTAELGTKSLYDKISSTKHQITNNFQSQIPIFQTFDFTY